MTLSFDPPLAGLAVALGGGLLIGLERERRKGQGPQRGAAGMRSFALAAMAGALAQTLQQPLLVAAGALAVIVLAGVAYWYGRRLDPDPGLTTELALFITYLIGVLAVGEPLLGAGAAVVVVVLLVGRQRLHHFAVRALTEGELHDALLLAALALVLLPLLPNEGLPWLVGANPRSLLLLVVLILTLQGAGHAALRLLGERAGFALTGLCGGFVSSTATVASLGTQARAHPTQTAATSAAAVMSTAATWVLALVLVTALSPALARQLAPAAFAGGLTAAITGALLLMRQPTAARPPEAHPRTARGPLRLREASVVAALLTGVTLAVAQAHRMLGDSGAIVGVMLAALADSHAAVSAVAALHARQELDLPASMRAILLAVAVNAALRCIVAFVAGGRGYGFRVSASLLASTSAAALVAWFMAS